LNGNNGPFRSGDGLLRQIQLGRLLLPLGVLGCRDVTVFTADGGLWINVCRDRLPFAGLARR
jgi:hypothetical protein